MGPSPRSTTLATAQLPAAIEYLAGPFTTRQLSEDKSTMVRAEIIPGQSLKMSPARHVRQVGFVHL
jgi:hypothetical protein